jgi:cell division protein ZapA (FtsZ GTPase activity inhibitor)
MIRCRWILMIVGMLLLASAALAQQETATPLLPPTDTPAPTVPLAAESSAADSVNQAMDAAMRAENALNRANDLIGWAQALGIFLIALIVVAAVLVFRRIQSLEKRLDTALDSLDQQAHDLKEVEKAVGKIDRS